MSRRRRKSKAFFGRILSLLAIPLLFISVGYALLAQDLSVTGVATTVDHSAPQGLVETHTVTSYQQGQKHYYTFNITITNYGPATYGAWQMLADIPAGKTAQCTSANCSTASSGTVTATNLANNGQLAPGSSVNFTLTFSSKIANYDLQNIQVSGLASGSYYGPISGLTVSSTAGNQTKVKKYYYRNYTIVVSNNSGQNLAGWRVIIANWPIDGQVRGYSGPINYIANNNELIFTSTGGLAPGQSATFTADLGTRSSTWTPSLVVEGRL